MKVHNHNPELYGSAIAVAAYYNFATCCRYQGNLHSVHACLFALRHFYLHCLNGFARYVQVPSGRYDPVLNQSGTASPCLQELLIKRKHMITIVSIS